jgi:copper chaperone CopZ
MKKLITIMFALLMAHISNAQYTKATVQASGLTCSMCNKAIYKALSKIAFVDTVTTNIKNSTYTVTFKTDNSIALDELKNAVTDAGFAVAKMELFWNANNIAVKNNEHIAMGNHYLHFVNVPTKSLQGEVKAILLDKNFTTDKLHKQYNSYTTMPCYKTGKMENCCSNNADSKLRVYHVTI